jgi:O-antigen ligase
LINRYINYLIVAYAFVIPISRAAIVLFSFLLIVLFLISEKGNYKKIFAKIMEQKVLMVLFIFIIYHFISLLYSDHLYEGFRYIYKYWYYLVIPVIFIKLDKKYINYSISAFLLGMMISEILSYGIFFELWQLKHGTPSDPTPFMNHLQYSMFLTFTSLLLLNRVFFEENIKWRIFYSLYFLTVTSNLFLNGGRTGHLAFAVSIFVVGFLNIKNKIIAFLSMLVLVVAIFYTAYNVSPVFKTRFDASINETNKISNNQKNQYHGSFGTRLALWIVGVEIIKENPILGVGVGDSMPVLRDMVSQKGYEDKVNIANMPNYHNYYIQIAVQLGIIGLVLYLLFFYYILKIDIKDKIIKNMMIIFVTVYCVASSVENMFHQQFSMAILALFVGLFLAKSRIEIEKNEI